MAQRRRHWKPNHTMTVTACGRLVDEVIVVEANPEAVDCGRCRVTHDFMQDTWQLLGRFLSRQTVG